MPLRGESVGTAYVRVLADASGFPRSLKKEMDDADAVFDDAGSVGAKRYKKAFDEEMQSHTGRTLDDALSDALAKDDFAEKFFKSDNWRKFETNVKARFGGLGQKAADQIREDFTKRGSLDGIETRIRGIVSQINNDISSNLGENSRSDHAFTRVAQNIDSISDKVARAFGKGSRNDFINFTGSFIGGALRMVGVIPRIIGNVQELKDGFDDARKTGEGFWSSAQQGLETMAKDAEGASTSFSKVAELGPGALLALGAALLALIGVLGPVAALISGIGGAVIALAGSLAFAVVGVIAPLVGLVAPLVLILGAAVAGIIAMSTHTKNLAKIITPVIDTFKELGKSVEEGFLQTFDLKKGIQGVLDVMRQFHPLFESIGEEFGKLATGISKLGENAAFKRFVRVMTDFAPVVLHRLLIAIGNVGSAFTSIFIDTIPDARDFLKWLDKITNDFKEWVNTNPDKIRGFLDDAKDSAKAVGGFLAAAIRLLGTLLSSGKSTGDDLFTSLAKNTDKFNQFLKDNPDALKNFFDNAKTVAQDLGDIAVDLGRIFDALDSPEARQALGFILGFIKVLIDFGDLIVEQFNIPLKLASKQIETIGKVAHSIQNGLKRAKDAIGDFFNGLSLGGGGRGGSVLAIRPPNLSWIPNAARKISSFFSGITHAANIVDFSSLRNKVGNLVSDIGRFFASIPGKLQNLTSGFGAAARNWVATVKAIISDLPGDIVDMFRGLAGRIVDAIGTIVPHVHLPNTPLPGPLALGGLVNGAQLRLVGEAGPEAVVPLTGPLNQVDPSVRWLAALARGQVPVGAGSAGGGAVGGPSKTINNEFHITTTTTDTLGVAREMVNQMVASSY